MPALLNARTRIALPEWVGRQGGLLFIWLLLLLFVIYPLTMLLQRAIFDNGTLSLGALSGALKSTSNLRALRNSLELAALVGTAGTFVGFVFAFTVECVRLGSTLRWLIDRSTFLPLISPPFTTSIAIVFSFGPRGLITYDLLGLQNVKVYGLASTFAAETLTYFPIAYLALRPMLASMSNSLEEASFSLGASRWRAFRTVSSPWRYPASPMRSCCFSVLRWPISLRL
jgi:iron(III) transport system permease protein